MTGTASCHRTEAVEPAEAFAQGARRMTGASMGRRARAREGSGTVTGLREPRALPFALARGRSPGAHSADPASASCRSGPLGAPRCLKSIHSGARGRGATPNGCLPEASIRFGRSPPRPVRARARPRRIIPRWNHSMLARAPPGSVPFGTPDAVPRAERIGDPVEGGAVRPAGRPEPPGSRRPRERGTAPRHSRPGVPSGHAELVPGDGCEEPRDRRARRSELAGGLPCPARRLAAQRTARKNLRSRGAICSRNLRPLNVP